VIDAANGVEPQTRRLLQVCRVRNTPILTFVNKMDREVQEPLNLMDEIERELGMTVVPFTWPVGMGKFFGGVMDLRKHQMRVFKPGEDRANDNDEIIDGLDNPILVKRFGAAYEQAAGEVELVRDAAPAFDEAEFLAGRQTPMFFGSAVNNFGVQEVLDALVDLAPPPGDRPAMQRLVHPEESKFTGVVFKIQANMDPSHRDRIAFLRVASGHFERGMKLKVVRSGKELRPNTVVSFLSQRRELLDEAYAGDIIGIPNHGTIKLGDTFSEGEGFRFTGIPSFAPELFRRAQIRNPLKLKQLHKGLQQLAEEGATQLFRPIASNDLILGAVGTLQFDVVAHRLEHEYAVEAGFEGCTWATARWLRGPDSDIKQLVDKSPQNIALDGAGDYVYLAPNRVNLQMAQEKFPGITFAATREIA